jgi:murein DD-endopeptidase MepM/ murein hydrolase activator NlpD
VKVDTHVYGAIPPLNARSESDYSLVRRAFNIRWLAAIIALAGCAASLLTAALTSSLGRRAHFAAPPIIFRRPTSARGINRSALGAPFAAAKKAHGHQTFVEQLDGKGSSTKPFTHVLVRLDRMPASPSSDVGPSGEAVEARNLQLPNLIVQGTHDLALPRNIESFAPLRMPFPGRRAAPIGDPINVTTISKSPETKSVRQARVIVARPNDTMAAMLQAVGLTNEKAVEISAQLLPSSWLHRATALEGGERITIAEAEPDDENANSAVTIGLEMGDGRQFTVALTDDGHYKPMTSGVEDSSARRDDDGESRDDVEVGGRTRRQSLYEAASAQGLDKSLVDQVARLSAHDLDLEAPTAPHDQVDILYDKTPDGTPQIVYSAVSTSEGSHTYYRYVAPDDGSTDYYDAAGRSVTQFLLRKPVAEGRLGDGFGWRIHPVLRDRRFHQGVDYAAPYGSPIAAAGAGIVEKIDQQWGYGKYIRLRHDLGYETTYAHISRVPAYLHVGSRVQQGEPIAFIGSTGLSTGPHLYYEVRINGRNVDPLRVRLAAGRMLVGDELESFHKTIAGIDDILKASNEVMREASP